MSKRLLFLAHFHLCSEFYQEVDIEKIKDLKNLDWPGEETTELVGSICSNLVKSIGSFRRFPHHLIVKNMDNDGVERNKNVGENWVVVGWVVNLE